MFVKIPSIKENVSVVESFIENVGEKIKIEDSIYGNVLVSVTEAVNNAIVHGNKENKNKKVSASTKTKQKKREVCC
jgi:serine/threonine-protein kinase RsbW